MDDWRDRILKEFTPRIAPLTLVADPDGLLHEETLLEAIRERGFEILPFDDSVAFRFAYESRFRSHWDWGNRKERGDRGNRGNGGNEGHGGETADLVVVVRAERHELATTLPWDLLRTGRQLSFGLDELFPGLSYPVVASLDRGHLAALHRAWMRHGADRLGDDATRDFALLHVFDVAPALVRRPADLLRVLLRRHHRGQRLPRILDERLIHLLRRGGEFDAWPLEAIVPDREAFFSFLQERWPPFLDRLAGNTGDGPGDAGGSVGLALEGPAALPFEHDDVRVYIDNLFVEGMLTAVPHEAGDTLRGTWAAVGIRFDPEADRLRRLEGLMGAVGASIPGSDARHHEWTAFACRWAELEVLRLGTALEVAAPAWREAGSDSGRSLSMQGLEAAAPAEPEAGAPARSRTGTPVRPESGAPARPEAGAPARSAAGAPAPSKAGLSARPATDALTRPETDTLTRSETGARIAELRTEVDRAFLAWIERRYAGLHNQPPDPPVMVHHVPRHLARRIEDGSEDKVALVVVDGLALDQWIVLRDVLAEQRPRLRFRESAVFAWVPTITSVSRQAIFAGKPPFYFPSSIHTTDREPSSWRQFWEDQGMAARAVGYAKGLGDGPLDGIGEILSRADIRALGLVVDKVDRIMHGMELGTAGMHNQVRQWAGEGFMAGLLDRLLDDGFAVFLTSDHGNIEAEGRGRPSEGVVADVRGERARIYPDAVLRSRVQARFPDAIAWPAIGLPEDCLALLAPARSAFVREGDRIVGHGGASLEEVVVPWVRIERAAT